MCSFFRLSFEASRSISADNQNRKYPLRFTEHELRGIGMILEKHRRFGKLAEHVVCPSSRVTTISVLNGQPRDNCVMTVRKFFNSQEGMYMYGLASSVTKENLTTPNLSTLLDFTEQTLSNLPQVSVPMLKLF